MRLLDNIRRSLIRQVCTTTWSTDEAVHRVYTIKVEDKDLLNKIERVKERVDRMLSYEYDRQKTQIGTAYKAIYLTLVYRDKGLIQIIELTENNI